MTEPQGYFEQFIADFESGRVKAFDISGKDLSLIPVSEISIDNEVVYKSVPQYLLQPTNPNREPIITENNSDVLIDGKTYRLDNLDFCNSLLIETEEGAVIEFEVKET